MDKQITQVSLDLSFFLLLLQTHSRVGLDEV